MSNGMYYAILATICWTRLAPKSSVFGGWVVFIGLSIASWMGWL